MKRRYVWNDKEQRFIPREGEPDDFMENARGVQGIIAENKPPHVGWMKQWECASLPPGQQTIVDRADFVRKAKQYYLAVEENH